MSISFVKHGRHRFASSRWHQPSRLEPRRDTRHQLGCHLRRHSPDPGLLSAIFRLTKAHRNEIQVQRASFAADHSGCSARGFGTRGFASFQAHRPAAGVAPSGIRQIEQWLGERACDGFIVAAIHRRRIEDFVPLVIPELQCRVLYHRISARPMV